MWHLLSLGLEQNVRENLVTFFKLAYCQPEWARKLGVGSCEKSG